MIRVMVVDDDPLIRRALAGSLARSGFDVSTADTTERALRLAEVAPPAIVLVDLNMPGGGLDLVRVLKDRHGMAMHVSIISGEDPDWIRADCEKAGADEVLAKPISPAELRRHVIAASDAVAAACHMLRSVAS
jgi:DNA-binding response OmpR family regulator